MTPRRARTPCVAATPPSLQLRRHSQTSATLSVPVACSAARRRFFVFCFLQGELHHQSKNYPPAWEPRPSYGSSVADSPWLVGVDQVFLGGWCPESGIASFSGDFPGCVNQVFLGASCSKSGARRSSGGGLDLGHPWGHREGKVLAMQHLSGWP